MEKCGVNVSNGSYDMSGKLSPWVVTTRYPGRDSVESGGKVKSVVSMFRMVDTTIVNVHSGAAGRCGALRALRETTFFPENFGGHAKYITNLFYN